MAREMGLAYSTVRDWLVTHAREKSWQALRPQAHRQEEDADRRRLGVYQEMVEWQPRRGTNSRRDSWQINMVLEMVRKRLGISCRVRTLKRVLRRLGFSYSKPRPIPDKSASEAETGGVQAGDCRVARRDGQAGPCRDGM